MYIFILKSLKSFSSYHVQGELRYDKDLTHIAKEGYKDVCLIIMDKEIKLTEIY